jgi:hypothetical protein
LNLGERGSARHQRSRPRLGSVPDFAPRRPGHRGLDRTAEDSGFIAPCVPPKPQALASRPLRASGAPMTSREAGAAGCLSTLLSASVRVDAYPGDLKQPPNPAENTSTVGIEDRWYMRRTPPPSRQRPPRRPPPSQPPGRPSQQPLPRRRTAAGVRLLIIALVGIILILATILTAVESQRCREGFKAPVCRI